MYKMLMEDLTLVTYGYLLLILTFSLCRDELLRWFMSWSSFLYVYYSGIGTHFDIRNRNDIIATVIFTILQIAVTIYIIKNKIHKEYLKWRPIVTISLFVVSLILHKLLSTCGMPWFTGYILMTLSFVVGIALCFKKLTWGKGD